MESQNPSDPVAPDDGGLGSDFVTRSREVSAQGTLSEHWGSSGWAPTELRKGSAVIHMSMVGKRSRSLLNQRIFDACLLVVNMHLKRGGQGLVDAVMSQEAPVSPVFETRVTDFARLANIPGKNYQRIYAELDALYDSSFIWNIADQSANAGIAFRMKSHFFSLVGYGEGSKRGLIRFALDPRLLWLAVDPKIWASLSLKAMAEMSTSPSYALYQNVWRYLTTANQVTAALPTATWVELLVGESRFVKKAADGSLEVVNYKDFKRRVLVDAMTRINACASLNHEIRLIEHRSGNRVVKLQFKFEPKKTMPLDLLMARPQEQSRLTALGLSESQIKDIFEAHSQELVTDALQAYDEALARQRAKGRVITSPTAYFRGILNNLAQGASKEDVANDDAMAQQAARQEQEQRASERRKRLEEEFSRHQSDTFGANLQALGDDAKGALIRDFLASDEARRQGALLKTGLTTERQSKGSLVLLRLWTASQRPDVWGELLPHPQDRAFDDWLMWQTSTDVVQPTTEPRGNSDE